MNRIKKYNIEVIKYYLLIMFVVVQPILDTYYLYTDKIINIFGSSPSTIIRFSITGILMILTLATLKDKRIWKLLIIYTLLIIIYLIAHINNAKEFYSLVPGNFNFSAKDEILYVIRLTIPLCIILITYNLKISYKHFENSIKVITSLVAGSIVITNILNISLSSYTNERVKSNIFGWFTGAYENYNYSSLASKGFFNFANQIAALLVLLLVLMLYIYIKNSTKSNLLIVITTIISMVMLGTKVALFGAIIDIIVFIVMAIFISVFKKESIIGKKFYFMNAIAILIMVILIPKAPALNREQVSNYVEQNNSDVQIKSESESQKPIDPEGDGINTISEEDKIQENDNEENKSNEEGKIEENKNNKEDKIIEQKNEEQLSIEYIENNYKNLMINEEFIVRSYPYQYDPGFWIEIMNLPIEERLDYRNLEQRMLQRVMDINDNPMDKWLGISFSRTQNIYNLERDFISQYYSIGILGVLIFIGPYIFICISCLINMLRNLKEKFTLFNCTCGFGAVFLLGVSYYSGNVLDALTVVIVLAFVLGKLAENVFEESKMRLE